MTTQITSDNPLLSLPTEVGVGSASMGVDASIKFPSVDAYIDMALSENTKLAYRCDLQDFLSWGGEVPASPHALAAYIVDRAVQLSPHTISRRVVGIGLAHTSRGFANPSKCDLVRMTMRGIRRMHGKPQRQAKPLMRQELVDLLPHMRGKKGVRDRALVLLGFAAALRRSELVAVNVEDLTFSEEGVVLHLQRSKTDQNGAGRRIGVPYGRTSACPVLATSQWLLHSGAKTGAVFRAVNKSGVVGSRLSSQSVSRILKCYATKIGLDTSEISGHSLRAGFVTSAAHVGAPIHKIQQQTGHKSLAMLSRYIRDARLFVDNPCAAIL